MDKKTTFNVWYFVAAFAGILLLQSFIASFAGIKPIAYSEFQQLLRDGRVTEVAVSDRFISGAVKEAFSSGESRFTTTRVDEDFAEQLGKFNVKVTGQIESTFLRDLLSWVVPVLLFGAVWFFLMRRMSAGGGLGGGLMSIGKSKAKVYVETDTGVTFADVAGVDEAKQELQEIVDFLKNPQHYGRLGGRMPKGVLLVGPPGTGKTLIAKAVAGEAKVPFFSISGSEFVEMFVGVGAARVRDLFEQARALAPAIIFIDELDAMGRSRLPGAMGGGNDEKEQTLNQLLVELDGFDTKSGVVLLAATNRPEILDPALLRAGRFDRQVLVDRPDKHGRVQILTVHLKKIIVGADVEPEAVAALTPGFTGADLANLVNEAALLATRRNADAVAMTDFNNAIERIIAGLEKKNRLINPKEREIVAFHEMGHAITAMAIPGSDPVHKVSIIPRGIGALGYTIQRPLEDRYIVTRAELENKMVVLLGGRAAEWIVFQHLSTGASDDLRRVTDIARSMVVQYGMSPTLGNVTYERDQRGMLGGMAIAAERAYAETTASQIDREVHDLAEHAFDRAVTILTERRPLLDATAHKLLETETLDGAAINAIAAGMARPSGEASGSKHASGGKGPGAL